MQPVKIGLLGMGTVGGGTVNVLTRNAQEIARRAGRGIHIAHAAARAYNADAIKGKIGENLRASLDMADVGFQLPHIEERSAFEAHQSDLVEIGYQTMAEHLPRLERFDLRRAAAIVVPGDEFTYGGTESSDARVVRTETGEVTRSVAIKNAPSIVAPDMRWNMAPGYRSGATRWNAPASRASVHSMLIGICQEMMRL